MADLDVDMLDVVEAETEKAREGFNMQGICLRVVADLDGRDRKATAIRIQLKGSQ